MHEGIEEIREAVLEYGDDTQAYKALGNIRVVKHDTEPYLLFNYTERAEFEGTWNAVERVSRGLILNYRTAELVALPFEKFFNLEQKPETSLLNLPNQQCEVTSKLDGSLGILYWCSDGPAIATRGSFTSEQALWATRFLRERFDLSRLDRDVTLLFEIIYPENRVVLDYDIQEALVLIGARNMSDEFDYQYHALRHFGLLYGFLVTPLIGRAKIDEIAPFMGAVCGVEGWVARFPTGLRVKIKTDEYKRLHRLISQLTPKHVRDLLLQEGPAWTEYLSTLPDEFYKEATSLRQQIMRQVTQQETTILAAYESIKHLASESRKAYALEVIARHKAISGYLFALLDGQPLRPLLLKNLELTEEVLR